MKIRWIDGETDLDQINMRINQQEKAALQFQSSQLAPQGGKPGNQVTFDELEPGTVGKSTTIVRDGGAAPAGTEKVWSGTMVISKSITAVTAFRAP